PEPDICGAVEPGNPADERLLEGLVVRKALEIEGNRLSSLLPEIEQLDLVPCLRRRRAGVGGVKSEVTFQAVERGALFDWSARKRPGHEVDRGERRVRRLDGQRRRDLLWRKRQNVADRNVLLENPL